MLYGLGSNTLDRLIHALNYISFWRFVFLLRVGRTETGRAADCALQGGALRGLCMRRKAVIFSFYRRGGLVIGKKARLNN